MGLPMRIRTSIVASQQLAADNPFLYARDADCTLGFVTLLGIMEGNTSQP